MNNQKPAPPKSQSLYEGMKPVYKKPAASLRYKVNFDKVKTLEDVIVLLNALDITVDRSAKYFDKMAPYLMPDNES